MIQASHSTLSDAALALKASARAGQSMPDLRGWTEISWSNEGIEYWRRGDRLFLPPSEKGGEWQELLSPRRRIPESEEEDEWREPPLPSQPKRRRRQRQRPPDGLLTASEAAAKLRCSIKTLNGHVDAGDLKYVVIGHGRKRPRKIFTDADLDAFIAARTRKDVPCPSTAPAKRHTGISTSNTEVIGFTARRNARLAAKPKK